MEDNIDELKRYLGNCVESWVDHDLLRMQFTERVIWEAVASDYLKVTRTFHRYNVRVNRTF